MEGVIGLLEASAENLRMKIRRVVVYLAFHVLHIRCFKSGRGLAPVRTRAARSRYRTRRAGIPLHAMAGTRYEYTVACAGKVYGDEGEMYCRVGTGDLGTSGNAIGVLDGDPLSIWEDRIALYFYCVEMIGRRDSIGCDGSNGPEIHYRIVCFWCSECSQLVAEAR